jgi:hypothetical protein
MITTLKKAIIISILARFSTMFRVRVRKTIVSDATLATIVKTFVMGIKNGHYRLLVILIVTTDKGDA